MTIKSAASGIGSGIVTVLSAAHNASVRNQIEETDSKIEALVTQLAELHETKTKLENDLIK